MSDGCRKPSLFLAEGVPMATEPGGTGFGSKHCTFHGPLSTGAFETLGDDLFTAAFNRSTADQITLSPKEIVAHALAIVGEVGNCLSGFLMLAGEMLTGKKDFFDLTLPERFNNLSQPRLALGRRGKDGIG